MHGRLFFQDPILEFINLFLIGKVSGSWKLQVVGEDVNKNLIIFLIFKDFVFVGSAVEDVIEVLRLKIANDVLTGH